jgi:hypothetical protein
MLNWVAFIRSQKHFFDRKITGRYWTCPVPLLRSEDEDPRFFVFKNIVETGNQ